jgi:Terminase large subunit, T4likevirus-type, N-terminal
MLMAGDIRMALNPALIGERVGLTLDSWQAQLLQERPKRALLCCARQSGKTTVAALMAIWTALYEAPALVLIVSPSQRQSGEVFRSLMLLYQKLKDSPEPLAESTLRVELANGSRIIALPGSERTIRGYAGAKLIVLDEAARVEDDLMAALRPTMATVDGSLIALSTPFGKRGWFHQSWTEGGQDWTRVRIPASECPRISPEFLADERRELGAMRFSEEYELAFLEPDESMFPTAIIDRAFTADVRPLWS